MTKSISTRTLALANIRRKPYRSASLIILIALTCAVLFGSLILLSSLKGGIYGIQTRIGADLMLVPKGFESKMENVLLTGEPNYFYMDKSIEENVKGIEGVSQVTSQFYLTSLSEGCCDFPIQLIGFNPETDFIIKNWAKSRFRQTDGILFAGNNVNLEKDSVRFFGGTHKVTSKLAKSGSGMDNAIYTDLATLQKIFEDSKSKGFGFISDGDTGTKVSVIFIKIKEGYGADGVSLRIQNAIQDVQVIQSGKFVSNLIKKLSSILIFLYALCFLVILIAVLTLSVVFLLSLNERLKEFAILRVLGADHAKLCRIVLAESKSDRSH
ncbi:ABC transporter permease, partial [Treponema sp.]|uniref:ABC transporter permease n=1 Tax=Treponema sp. TaxID=166 RepID=UPI00388FAD07